jgi:site-specific DNA recombinase
VYDGRMNENPTSQVAIYVRLSQDDGRSTALERQEKDCRAIAEREGYSVVRVYSDNDLSAYGSKERPEFVEMLGDIRAGAYEAVLVWRIDRLSRNRRSLLEFNEALEASNTIALTFDGLDSRGQAWGLLSAISVELATSESKSLSIRQKAKQRELREQGKPSGGGKRPYGHSADWKTIHDDEAKNLQEAAKRVLAGEAVNAIVRDFNERGITTVNGKRWAYGNLRDMLRSYRLAGAREIDGRPNATGEIAEILPVEIVERLRALLRKRGTGEKQDARYLLSGKVVCGKCGQKMTHKRSTEGLRRYQCVRSNHDSCGKTVVGAENAENEVIKVLIGALNSPEWNETTKGTAIAGRANLLAQLEVLQARLAVLANDFYVDGSILREQFFAAQEPLQAGVRACKAALAATETATVIDSLIGMTPGEFGASPMGRKRGIISGVIDQVTILPIGVKSGPKFQTDRVQIAWKA